MQIFLYLRKALIFRQMCWKTALYSLHRQSGLCLIFTLSKNKGFQFAATLKMSPLSPSMEEFGVDIQK